LGANSRQMARTSFLPLGNLLPVVSFFPACAYPREFDPTNSPPLCHAAHHMAVGKPLSLYWRSNLSLKLTFSTVGFFFDGRDDR